MHTQKQGDIRTSDIDMDMSTYIPSYLENVETQLSISGGGFSRSGMRFRPKPGENRALYPDILIESD